MGRNHPNSLAGTGCTAIFLIVWLTGWSAGTLFFDGMCVHNFIAQYQARDYPSVIGNVTHSKVRVHHDSDGTSRSAEIKYNGAL